MPEFLQPRTGQLNSPQKVHSSNVHWRDQRSAIRRSEYCESTHLVDSRFAESSTPEIDVSCRPNPSCNGPPEIQAGLLKIRDPEGWLGSRVVSVLDSGAVGPGFKSQS